MVLNLLSDVIEELGYPRNNFLNISRAGNNQPVIYTSDFRSYTEDFYIVTIEHKNNTTGYTLIRLKNGKFDRITDMISNHLTNSIIKNIILNTELAQDIKYNMLLYILYYRVVYKANNPLTDKEITDGIILELANLIKILIDRENTTYKGNTGISDAIDEIRILLKRERIHIGIRPKLNLRR